MSNYPEWWDRTVTVYNMYKDPTTAVVTWYSTVLTGCFWKDVGTKVTVGNTVVETEDIICRIPEKDSYVSPFEWFEREDKSDVFTLKQGDIIILGECDDKIDEYTKGQRSTDLLKKYHSVDSCMEIKKVAIDTMTGMMLPHYRIVGV